MNCPSRPDPIPLDQDGYNQSPHPLALESNNDRNGLANRILQRDHRLRTDDNDMLEDRIGPVLDQQPNKSAQSNSKAIPSVDGSIRSTAPSEHEEASPPQSQRTGPLNFITTNFHNLRRILVKFTKFVGPGLMISVAYIDPGNYATDVAAGANYKYQLLVMVLVSNIIAIFLQSLCIKLGSVTGMDLAQNVKAHCPWWLNIILYLFAEAAIIATDMAEVIGTAIALNLLLNIPIVAGCAISIVDVIIILLFYRPSGSMRGVRLFEIFVSLLVLAVVICFCIELSLISVPNVGELFRGFLPSGALVQREGLYQACGILGATVMPHSLYLGSGIVQPRLYNYDLRHGNVSAPIPSTSSTTSLISTTSAASHAASIELTNTTAPKSKPALYKPSLAAIHSCLSYSIAELAISLFTFALFVNSAILIVAGASLSNSPNAASASLFDIHALLSSTLAPAAGTVFALALLLSGTSAGIVCTIAGQMVSEGQLQWSVKPWVRRLVTRSISITPSIIIAGAVGKGGLSQALEATQVALSVILPVTSAPLIYFTMRARYMVVEDAVGVDDNDNHNDNKDSNNDNKDSNNENSSPAAIASGSIKTKAPPVLDERLVRSQSQSQPQAARTVKETETETQGAAAGPATTTDAEASLAAVPPRRTVNMKNHWITSTFAVAMWILIVVMNVASWVLTGAGAGA